MSARNRERAEALRRPLSELTRIFRETRDKHRAHERSRAVLAAMAGDPDVFSAVLAKHLEVPDALRRQHYPVVSLGIARTPDYEIVANCWIPLPGRETDVSTKAIHHHGNMLLTTATAFGPGYEHWTFTPPVAVDADREIYALEVVERAPHPLHHVAFVDAFVPHLPLYPPALSITLALWSNSRPTTWKDYVKRIPALKRNEQALRGLARRLGIARSFDLKVVEYFDFYPTEGGFKGMKDRKEFDRGPAADYLRSLFHVIQETGNGDLAPTLRGRIEAGAAAGETDLTRTLLADLEAGRPIEGRLSEGHYGIPFANFTRQEIERALAAQQARGAELVSR